MEFKSSITMAFKDAFSPGMKRATQSLAGMKAAMGKLSENQAMTRLAADMAMMTSMTEPMRRAISGALEQPARIAGTLDSAFKDIQVATGNTSAEMAALRQELLVIGGRAVAGPQAVANAFANIAGGIDGAEKRLAVMNASVALAEANQADLGATAKSMINIMNAWGLKAEHASIAADALTQTALSGNGSLEDFAGAVSDLSMLASGAGIGLGQLGATMAFVTTQGKDAADVQKQFKAIISTLVSPGENLSKIYRSLGIQSGQAMLKQYGLAGSLSILKDALGGNEQAFGDLVGSAEAAAMAVALAKDEYADFAGAFADGMKDITDAARGVQLESIEAKMARLDAASQAVQARIGHDVNNIKGFFADIKAGFLSDIVAPLMDTPVGGVFTTIAAGAGWLAEGVVDIGSSALNTATQMTTLAANISNAGGMAKVLKSSLGLVGSGFSFMLAPLRMIGGGMLSFGRSIAGGAVSGLKLLGPLLRSAGLGMLSLGKSIIGALPAMGSYIASMWAAVAPTLAATWPILAIIAGIALLAAGVYLIIKNWDKIGAFFTKLWNGVKAVFESVWNGIKEFFTSIWDFFKGIITAYIGIWKTSLSTIKNIFVGIWNGIKNFFRGVWDGFKKLITGFTGFFKGIWNGITSAFKTVWAGVKDFFVGIWNSIKGVVQSVCDWIRGALDDVIGSIKSVIDWIDTAIGDILELIGLRDSAEEKEQKARHAERFDTALQATASGASTQEVLKIMFPSVLSSGAALTDTFAEGIQSNAAAPAAAFAVAAQGVADLTPHSDAKEGPLSTLTSSGRALTDTFAAGMDDGALRDKASQVFSAAAPPAQGNTVAISPPVAASAPQRTGAQTIHIQNLYVQAEDCKTAFDFIQMLMQITTQPRRAPV